MDAKLIQIISKLKYSDFKNKNLHDSIPIWEKYLGVKIHNYDDGCGYYFVEVPTIDIILEKISKLENQFVIYVDCRFFAMFIDCLKNNCKLFQMVVSLKGIDGMVPDNCRYITLDIDYFVINKDTDHPRVLSQSLDDLTGQWVVEINPNSYMGIVDEGCITLSLSEWIEKYKKSVEKKIKEKKKEKSMAMIGILSCLIHKHGMKIGVYEYSKNAIENGPININK